MSSIAVPTDRPRCCSSATLSRSLQYLADKIRQRIGKSEAVAIIHGGIPRDVRKANIAAFNDDPEVRVLIANDAAGEGVNLQRGAHLMVNYDLPWNPNRLEQRFGRIHRIGQTEVCHLWNLVAADTREGEVYTRLLEKLERARDALGGRDSVYDVLGELFQGRPQRVMPGAVALSAPSNSTSKGEDAIRACPARGEAGHRRC
jgi:SNF2 family DNA or RNA helicase